MCTVCGEKWLQNCLRIEKQNPQHNTQVSRFIANLSFWLCDVHSMLWMFLHMKDSSLELKTTNCAAIVRLQWKVVFLQFHLLKYQRIKKSGISQSLTVTAVFGILSLTLWPKSKRRFHLPVVNYDIKAWFNVFPRWVSYISRKIQSIAFWNPQSFRLTTMVTMILNLNRSRRDLTSP